MKTAVEKPMKVAEHREVCGDLGNVNGERYQRVTKKFVRCFTCNRRVQLYIRKWAQYGLEFNIDQHVDAEVFKERLTKSGLKIVRLSREDNGKTSTRVFGSVTYDVRGNWESDVRGKIEAAARHAKVDLSKTNVIVKQWDSLEDKRT